MVFLYYDTCYMYNYNSFTQTLITFQSGKAIDNQEVLLHVIKKSLDIRNTWH